jgi:hemoglobin
MAKAQRRQLLQRKKAEHVIMAENMAEKEKTLYENLGGEPIIRQLVERFYHHMDTRPDVLVIREMHKDLDQAKLKLFEFLSGWTGGPQLFIDKYGHPMLRRRHLPFAIGTEERDQWLLCMKHAIDDVCLPEPWGTEFMNALSRLADHMRNTAST